MSFLKTPFQTIFSLLSPSKKDERRQNAAGTIAQPKTKRSASKAFGSRPDSPSARKSKRSRSSKSQVDFEEEVRHEANEVLPDVDSPTLVQTDKSLFSESLDRNLMPPPSSKNVAHRRKSSSQKAPRLSLEHAETTSQATRSSHVARSEVVDEYDMEEARRKAAATQLPPNSGIWDTGERELFFHLAYRGFEPLLPNNWMIDFPTLPLSVFAHQDTDTPLIQCHRSTQFRAIRALRELLDTGTSIRDKTVASRDMRTEPILNRAAKKFISWALKDMGYPEKPSKTTIPVHTIATLQPGQSTHDVIRKLASEMHILAAKHREAINVRSSVEQDNSEVLTPPHSNSEPTQIHGEKQEDEKSLPVIYGIMIASSILAIFTLNSHTPFPPFLVRALVRNQKNTLTPEKAAAINPFLPSQIKTLNLNNSSEGKQNGQNKDQDHNKPDEDSGIRFIANFDFSNSSADVWNALVIAVVAMQIRKTMGEVFATWRRIKSESHGLPRSNADEEENEENEKEDDGDNDEDFVDGVTAVPAAAFNFEESWLSNFDGIELDTADSRLNGLVGNDSVSGSSVAKSMGRPRTRRMGFDDDGEGDPDA